MTVMIVENVGPSIRGELSRWLIEIKPGVFIGNINALVRDEIWNIFEQKLSPNSSMLQIWTTNTEQGFDLKSTGLRDYEPYYYEGLWLVRKPPRNR